MRLRPEWLEAGRRSRAGGALGGVTSALQAALARALFTFELARRLEGSGVTANAFHPGLVRTRLDRNLPWPLRLPVRLVNAAAARRLPHERVPGFLSPRPRDSAASCSSGRRAVDTQPHAEDLDTARRLWETSEQLTERSLRSRAMSSAPDRVPLVVFTKYSPYLVVDVEDCRDAEGRPVAMQPVTSLCRCGRSAAKPYCDGTHSRIGFIGREGTATLQGPGARLRGQTDHDPRQPGGVRPRRVLREGLSRGVPQRPDPLDRSRRGEPGARSWPPSTSAPPGP